MSYEYYGIPQIYITIRSTNEDRFDIQSLNGTSWSGAGSVAANSTSVTVNGLQPDTSYSFRVCSTNAAGSNCSSTVSAKTKPKVTKPNAPTGVTATGASTSSIQLKWSAVAKADQIGVYRWNGNAWVQIAVTTGSATSYTDTGLQAGTTYYFSLCAGNVAGTSCMDGNVSAKTKDNPRTEVIIQENSSDFRRSGSHWYDAAGNGGHSHFTYCNGNAVDSSGEYSANLSGGRYEIQVWIPKNNATTHNAIYTLYLQGGMTSRSFNQAAVYDNWASLGTYDLDSGYQRRVKLNDATGEKATTQCKVNFDAVRFIPR